MALWVRHPLGLPTVQWQPGENNWEDGRQQLAGWTGETTIGRGGGDNNWEDGLGRQQLGGWTGKTTTGRMDWGDRKAGTGLGRDGLEWKDKLPAGILVWNSSASQSYCKTVSSESQTQDASQDWNVDWYWCCGLLCSVMIDPVKFC